MPEGMQLATYVLGVLGTVAGLELGIAFLMRAPRAALGGGDE